jgi:hypothetical protein
VIVRNAPFSAALADSYRIGIEHDRAWTLCIDADVLVHPPAIRALLDAASNVADSVCEVQGVVLDKFFGVRRPAGNHLYRTALLSKALSFIPADGKNARPEFHSLNKMTESGHPWVQTPVVVGLHDFEQAYRDIFRKCHVHAKKHVGQMHLLVDYWRRVAPHDGDFRVALLGLAAGVADSSGIHIDVRRDYGFDKWISAEGITEKAPLRVTEVTAEAVERVLDTWASPGPELEQYAAWCIPAAAAGEQSRQSASPRKSGPADTWMLLAGKMGRILGRAGRRLERLATRQ